MTVVHVGGCGLTDSEGAQHHGGSITHVWSLAVELFWSQKFGIGKAV